MGMTIFMIFALLALPALATERGGPKLLELYSSEGCSSCPSADAFVSTLKGHKGLWRDFVPVVFHVDYWDYLGWKDELASPLFTRRQKSLGRLVTPGFVLDGKAWWTGDMKDLRRSSVVPGSLEVKPEGLLRYRITFQSPAPGPWRVHAALLGFGVVSAVSSGENAGTTLSHDFVALGYGTAELEERQVVITVKPNLKVKAAGYGYAVWVSRGDAPAPVQSVGGFLEARR